MPLGFLNFTELWPFLQSLLEIKMGLRSLPRYIPENSGYGNWRKLYIALCSFHTS